MKLTKRWRRTHEQEEQLQRGHHHSAGGSNSNGSHHNSGCINSVSVPGLLSCLPDLNLKTPCSPLKTSASTSPSPLLYFGSNNRGVIDLSYSTSPRTRDNAVAHWLQQNHQVSGPLSPPTTPPTPHQLMDIGSPCMSSSHQNQQQQLDCNNTSMSMHGMGFLMPAKMEHQNHHHHKHAASAAATCTNNNMMGQVTHYATSSCSLSSSTSCFSSTSSSGFGDTAYSNASPQHFGDDRFNSLYLLASAAVSELERQRTTISVVTGGPPSQAMQGVGGVMPLAVSS